jgi:hypothetical protein
MLANRSCIRFAGLALGSEHAAFYVRREGRRGFSALNLVPSPECARFIEHIDRSINATGLYRGVPSG